MRLLTFLAPGCLAVLLGACPAPAQDAVPEPQGTAPGPTTPELIEDLRILSIVNAFQPTRDQSSKLAAVAQAGKEGLAAIDTEVKAKLDQQRDRLRAAREKVLRGEATPRDTEELLAIATQAAQNTRSQKTEALIVTLASRVRSILSREQAELIGNELAPNFDQPWRRYSRLLAGTTPAGARGGGGGGGGRMPVDPGKWLKELRDLRVDSAEGDPNVEIEDFGKKLSRGLPANSPLFQQAFNQGRTLATQVLAMPPNVFNQRELELARFVARQELDTRNQQRILEGKPTESFDPYRWLVEEVMLSPRAAADFRDRAAGR